MKPKKKDPEADFEQLYPRQMGTALILAALYCSGFTFMLFTTWLPRLLSFVFGTLTEQQELTSYVVRMLFYIVMILVLGNIYKQALRSFRKEWIRNSVWIILGFVVYFLLSAIIVPQVIAIFHPVSESANNLKQGNLLLRYPVLFTLNVVLIGPLIEELVFRVGIFRALRKYSLLLAVLGSSLLFGFIHVFEAVVIQHNMAELWNLIPYFVSGIWLATLYEKRKNILIPLSVHMIANLLGALLTLNQ